VSPRPLHRSVLLWRLRRHPLLWWALALLAVAVTAVALQGSLDAAARRAPAASGPSGSSAHESASEPAGTLADSVPSDARAVAVPTAGGLVLTVGDEVDVVAPGEPAVEGALVGEPRTVAEAALVVQVAPEAVTVAVPADDAAAVALAVSQGGTTLVLRGTG
jgi:hypothetical protein